MPGWKNYYASIPMDAWFYPKDYLPFPGARTVQISVNCAVFVGYVTINTTTGGTIGGCHNNSSSEWSAATVSANELVYLSRDNANYGFISGYQ